MACARPVVATAVDGTPEAVREGETGYLFQPGDLETAASRVIELLRDRQRARAMGEAGRDRVGEFDIDEMVRQQEVMYEDLMEQQGGGAP